MLFDRDAVRVCGIDRPAGQAFREIRIANNLGPVLETEFVGQQARLALDGIMPKQTR
jgi:hypothetical protein